MPFSARGVALNERARRPVAVLTFEDRDLNCGQQRLIDMRLPAARDDVARTLCHDGSRLVVVDLMQRFARNNPGSLRVDLLDAILMRLEQTHCRMRQAFVN